MKNGSATVQWCLITDSHLNLLFVLFVTNQKQMKMIQDIREIRIDSSPDIIFDLIDKMPNKFPIYKILETKPFIFLRILLVDGFRTAIEAASMEQTNDELILNVGDKLGPFTLTEKEKPIKYHFTLKSFFFNCQTGYFLSADGGETKLHFGLFAENPSLFENVWWVFFKPFHSVFANKALKVIKKRINTQRFLNGDHEAAP